MESFSERGSSLFKIQQEALSFGSFLQRSRRVGYVKIAQELGIAPSTVYGWESGRTLPNKEDVPRIALVYKVDEAELHKFLEISIEARRVIRDENTNAKLDPPPRKINSDTEVFWSSGRGKHSGPRSKS